MRGGYGYVRCVDEKVEVSGDERTVCFYYMFFKEGWVDFGVYIDFFVGFIRNEGRFRNVVFRVVKKVFK